MTELSVLAEKKLGNAQMAKVAAFIRGYGGWPKKSTFLYCNVDNSGAHSDC